jgi:hypothetical protein
MKTLLARRPGIGALLVAGALLAGCEAQLREGAGFSIDDFVSGVQSTGGTQATLVRGNPPSATGSMTANVTGVPVMINGGSGQQSITSASAFSRVIVSVDGLDDYYRLDLPAGVTAQDIIVSLNTRASSGQMPLRIAVGDAGSVGAYAYFPMRIIAVGSGDIQISASWTDSADVDLHVIDPDGNHIYFANKTSPTGGVLDLDANAACSPNETAPRVFYSNENIVWPTGQAPNGTYKVFLDYWSDCGVAQTDWVVTIQRQGAPPEIHTGTFVGNSSGVPDDTVSVFTY